MPTECSAELFEFGEAARCVVVAGFDGGAVTSDAGALLLGATDRTIRPPSRRGSLICSSTPIASHRRSAARPPGRAVLPRLLRLLLLPAALRLLRPASAGS